MTIHIVQWLIVWLRGNFKMKKLSVSLSGHQTSISLEEEFITALHAIAIRDGKSVASIIQDIDSKRDPESNLSSAVRLWILHRYMQSAK